MARFDDDIEFAAGVDLSNASGAGVPKVLVVPFVLADITAGTKSVSTLPANALIRGVAIRITTALTFSAGTTTGVTAKAGTSGDDDGYFAATQLSGAAGYRYPAAAGALVGVMVAGGANSCVITFAATGGTPDLAEVSAGAGTLYISYEAVA